MNRTSAMSNRTRVGSGSADRPGSTDQLRLELREWESTSLPIDMLTRSEINHLIESASNVIRVERDPRDEFGWRLTPRGYVGQFRVGDRLEIIIQPKVPIVNLFRMIESLFNFEFALYDSLHDCHTISDLLESLTLILCDRIAHRMQRGLYRSYEPRRASIDRLRGRLDLPRLVRSTQEHELPCRFSEQTTDNMENRILLRTLDALLRSGLFSSSTRRRVMRLHRALHSSISIVPVTPHHCANRTYNRLNSDYRFMHLLCRFFLEGLIPAFREGEQNRNSRSFGFLIDMATLFEGFVAAQLAGSPRLKEAGLNIAVQERRVVDPSSNVTFIFDLLVKDAATGQTHMVIDTKYRRLEKPSNDDIFQVVAYASQQGAEEALLLYPESEVSRRGKSLAALDFSVGPIHLRSRTVNLDRADPAASLRSIEELILQSADNASSGTRRMR